MTLDSAEINEQYPCLNCQSEIQIRPDSMAEGVDLNEDLTTVYEINDDGFSKLFVSFDKNEGQLFLTRVFDKSFYSAVSSPNDVKDIIGGGPVPKHIKPIWPFIAFTAFNTLPKEFKDIYGIKDSKIKSLVLGLNLKFLKYSRPFLPPFFRLIAPARWAKQRITKNPSLLFSDKAKF